LFAKAKAQALTVIIGHDSKNRTWPSVSKKLINSWKFEIATAFRASQLSPVAQATINEKPPFVSLL